MKPTLVLFCLLALAVSGCATWVAVGGKHTERAHNFEVALPEGWRKLNPASDGLLITRDGFSLQLIRVSRIAIDRELPHAKKKFGRKMLPQEAADIVIDNFKSNPNIMAQSILSNKPAVIGGQAGFRLHTSYRTTEGLTKNGLLYGFICGEWYYELIFEAPQRYYFEKDAATFERVKESFRLIKLPA
jgi:hypothetical protein